MAIPTELVGSLPRPMKLQEAYEAYDQGKIEWSELQAEQDAAADSIRRLEAVGEPIVTDGEQRESSFATYPITDTLAGTGLNEMNRLFGTVFGAPAQCNGGTLRRWVPALDLIETEEDIVLTADLPGLGRGGREHRDRGPRPDRLG